MMQITFLDQVVYADGSSLPVSASVTANDVTVTWQEATVTLTWEQIADVDYLSKTLADMSVRTFRVIVQMLGKIYAGRKLYKEM